MSGGRIPIDERADDMIEYFESRESVSYRDFSRVFDDYVTYLAVSEGPSSEIYEDDERIRVTEADLAVASHFGKMVEDAEDIDIRKMLKGTAIGAGTLGLGLKFLSTEDPDWLTPGLITGYFASNDLKDSYQDFMESREAKKERKSSLEGFEREYPGINGYEISFEDLEDVDVPVSSIRPGDMDEGVQELVDEEASGKGFQ